MTEQTHNCFHCGLDIPVGASFAVTIDGKTQPMCCPGCQAVAQAIVASNLTDYYRYRTSPAPTARDIVPEFLQNVAVFDHPRLQQQFVTVDEKTEIKEASLIIEGIVCAACVWLNEKYVSSLPGVIEFRVNFTTHRAMVKWDDAQIKLSDIIKAISVIGYLAHPVDAQRQELVHKRERRRALRRLAVAGLGSMQVMMLAVALYAGSYTGIDSSLAQFFRWISLLLATPVIVYSAWPFYVSAWRDLRLLRLGMDVPVAISIIAAFLASVYATLTHHTEVYFDSITMFVFFLLSGRYLEMQARHRAGEAAEAMVKLIPAMTTRLLANNLEEVIPVSELQPGDRVRIKPGETIPADGIVLDGNSSVDESLLTGESLPLRKHAETPVIGGSVNVESPLEIRIEKVGNDTVLAAIQRLLDRAQTEKPNIARLADRVAAYFIGALFLIAIAVGTYWYQHDPIQAFWIVIVILVVTCPCALSLATPVALIAATGRLMQLGVLTTRGHALETLAKVTHVVLDKTGTLTHGHLQIAAIDLMAPMTREQVLEIAASLERGSEHPLAKTIISATPHTNLTVVDRQNVPGRGIQGTIAGKHYRLGKPEFAIPAGARTQIPVQPMQTTIVLADEQSVLAVFNLQDSLRDDAKDMIQQLQKLGIRVSLCSGDHPALVSQVAQQLGIAVAKGGMLPADKLAYVQALQQTGEVVAMIGDGVNDAPVLAAAQVSIAMGNGTQLAQASSDMVLLSERLQQVVTALQLSRETHRIIRQNLLWAILYNVIALPLAAIGWVTPWMAGIGMSGSSLLVVINALRLRQFARE